MIRIRTITLRLEDEQHKQLKLYVGMEGITIQDYLVDLISKDTKLKEFAERVTKIDKDIFL